MMGEDEQRGGFSGRFTVFRAMALEDYMPNWG